MATFLVLPPRELLEHALADFFARTFPGVPIPNDLPTRVLSQVAAERPDTFIVHREDLPESADVGAELCTAFGAEPGDRVVEIGPPRNGVPAPVREWQVVRPVSEGASAR
jgi:hypothetical protein